MSQKSPDYAKAMSNLDPVYGLIALSLSHLCNQESTKMSNCPQDRARGMLFLGALFLCANIHTSMLYFQAVDNENREEN
jgi:hypothetical protein